MADQDRIKGWLTDSERRGHFDMGRMEEYAKYIGNHFFDADAKRFFRSRIMDAAYFGRNRTLFVTSEQFVDGRGNKADRLYTVRAACIDNGDGILGLHTDDVGGFQAYKTSRQAHAAAARIAQEETDREPTEQEAAIAARAQADIDEKEVAAEVRRAYWTPEAVAARKEAYDAHMAKFAPV